MLRRLLFFVGLVFHYAEGHHACAGVHEHIGAPAYGFQAFHQV